MNTPRHPSPLISFASFAVACTLLVTNAHGTPVPQNLGNGLDKLVESNLVLKGQIPAPAADQSIKSNGTARVAGGSVATYDGYATRQAANYARNAIVDTVANRFMV